MVESLFRSIQGGPDDSWKGELLHVQSFMDSVQDYVSKNGNSLRAFLKYWEDEDPSISSPSSGESVRVMTIHKSKGLDFPYVIIPFAENISLYKADNRWCRPVLEGTPLETVAEGVYDVKLSSSSADSLFAEDYRKETFLQLVDNINTLYVAMTRAALGMHVIAKTPSADCKKAVEEGRVPDFKDFSQILYWYVSGLGFSQAARCSRDGLESFEIGQMPDFRALVKDADRQTDTFPMTYGQEFPSGRIALSTVSYSALTDEDAGDTASSRIRGIVLHDILAGVQVRSDLSRAVTLASENGMITPAEAEDVFRRLDDALESVQGRGWFAEDAVEVHNEASLIDTDGQVYRPDRVVIRDGKVMVVDYKFGDHHRKYERQVKKYMDIWSRMGYTDVSGYLWYVDASTVVEV